MGHLDWLAAARGLEAQSLLKPSPVHALAALRRAAGDDLVDSLEAAARLALDQVDDGGWGRLEGAHTTVFDDSFRGLQSTRAAQAALGGVGIRITLDLRGVTTLPAKAQALEEAGGSVYPDFVHAARDVVDGIGWPPTGEAVQNPPGAKSASASGSRHPVSKARSSSV